MNFNVAVIPGDGIGPEIVREAQKVLGNMVAINNFIVNNGLEFFPNI